MVPVLGPGAGKVIRLSLDSFVLVAAGSAFVNLLQYLEHPPSGYAFLLHGPWGSGKTFTWQQTTQSDSFKLTAITLSVAGLSTTEDLERGLFQASLADKVPPVLREAGSIIGRAALRYLKIEPNDISLRADLLPESTVVCLDDIERFGGNFQVLLGFILNILDGMGVRCVLLSDEKRAIERFQDEYSAARERIIGPSQLVDPKIDAFFDSTVAGIANDYVRNAIGTTKDAAIQIFGSAGNSNLRSLRSVLESLARLAGDFPQQAQSWDLSKLFSAVAFYRICSSADVSTSEPALGVFRDAGFGMAMALASANESDTDNTEDRRVTLVRKHGFLNEAHQWPHSPELASYLEGRPYNAAAIAKNFGIDSETELEEDHLARANNFFELSDEELAASVESLQAEFTDSSPIAAQRLWDIAVCLTYLASLGLTAESEAEMMASLASRIDLSTAERLSIPEFTTWSPPSYHEQVFEALGRLAESAQQLEQQKWRQEAIEALITGEGSLPNPAAGLVLQEIQPSDLLDRLLARTPMDVRRLIRFFRGSLRISNAGEFVRKDGPAARLLAQEIRARCMGKPPLPILQAMLLQLADTLDEFAEHVQRPFG